MMPHVIGRPLAKTKLSDAVAAELERAIREGELMVGRALPSERDLMEAFTVGRPSIREALATLARKGLVRISSGERTVVTRPSPETIIAALSVMSKDFIEQPSGMRYFNQLRMFFETSLVRHAARHCTSEDLDELDRAFQLNTAATENSELFKKTDINFHRALARIPRNPIFEAVSTALADWVLSQRPTSDDTVTSCERSARDHQMILDAIRARDPEKAEQAMITHLEYIVTGNERSDVTTDDASVKPQRTRAAATSRLER